MSSKSMENVAIPILEIAQERVAVTHVVVKTAPSEIPEGFVKIAIFTENDCNGRFQKFFEDGGDRFAFHTLLDYDGCTALIKAIEKAQFEMLKEEGLRWNARHEDCCGRIGCNKYGEDD